MAGGNLSPRQKMINMLYLVLLALLALNVSAEVLRAFDFVNQGLEETRANFENQNRLLYQRFEAALQDDEDLVKPNHERAQIIRAKSDSLVAHLEGLKNRLIEMGGGRTPDGSISHGDNLNISSDLMIRRGLADELREKILDTRQDFFDILNEAGVRLPDQYDLSINAENPAPRPDEVNPQWTTQLFHYTPVTAAITNLSKLQTDVRNSEAEVVERLLQAVHADHIQFDETSAQVIPTSNFVMIGEEFQADIFLSAFSTTQQPDIYIEGERLEDIQAGKGRFSLSPNREGEHTYKGYIKVTDERRDSFEINFMAYEPTAIISATAMNMMYVGLENPISVSVPGFPADQVQARISNGTLRPAAGAGNFNVTLQEGTRETTISAYVETAAGEQKRMGEQRYRVRPLPRPEASIEGETEGQISRGRAGTLQRLYVMLGEGFAFEGINFEVERYRFMHEPRRGDPFQQTGSGNTLTQQMRNRLNNASSGDVFIITDIDAQGPDGRVRTRGITLTIQ